MKIYVSGPITGIPNKNREVFNSTAERLRSLGHEALNPFDLEAIDNYGDDWTLNMRRDLQYLVDCESLCLLPGWEESKGARLEVIVALGLGLKLYRLTDSNELLQEYVVTDTEIVPLIPSYLWTK